MKGDCRWLNDIECPYATGYQECEECDKYEEDNRPHPLDDSDTGCAKLHFMQDMGEIQTLIKEKV